jgi:ribonuclease P protein component
MKIQTLKKRKDFILSNKFAKKCHSNNFILQKYNDPEQKNTSIRFGFTATKKIGNAVYRNRAKRRMKALITLLLKNEISNFDLTSSYVLIAKINLIQASFTNLENEMKHCLNKL